MAATGTSAAANVTAAKPAVGGALYWAPSGTTAPTDASTALASSFVCLGYISEDGLSNNISRSSSEERAWGGDVVNVFESEFSDTFSTKLIETLNLDVLKAVFGSANVTGTLAGGITVKANAAEHDDAVFVVDMILKNNVLKRIVIPIGRVTEVGEISYEDDASTGYDITITCQADSSGNSHYEYIKAAASSGT